jgi:hypothetical protein
MGNGKIKGGLLASFFVLTASQLAAADIEPTNSVQPWTSGIVFNGAAELFNTSRSGGIGTTNLQITPSGDVDYILASCGGRERVNSVNVGFTHSSGDIDLKAFRLDGTLLGISQGVSNGESIDVSASNEDTIVMEVYGFNGATNTYSLSINCT